MTFNERSPHLPADAANLDEALVQNSGFPYPTFRMWEVGGIGALLASPRSSAGRGPGALSFQ
jgi:hypothetical protein